MALHRDASKMAEPQMVVCSIFDGDRVLLKRATRGLSQGKWVGPGGKVEPGETFEEAVRREVRQETGLEVKGLTYRGYKVCYDKDKEYEVNYFSAETFDGKVHSTEEGEVRWFNKKEVPYGEMWTDERFIMPLIMNGERFFVADLHYGDSFYGRIVTREKTYIVDRSGNPITISSGGVVTLPEGKKLALIDVKTGEPMLVFS
jgi:8-oxo-dGTP diphosphatase